MKNVDHFLQQLQKIKQSVNLDPARKDEVRARLLAFMDANPVREKHPWAAFFSYLQIIPIAAFALLLVLILGGTSFAAERALPGDFLYPVKVHVNEEVRAAFAVNPESKANWASRRAERRLEEAGTLSGENRLSVSQSAQLEANFEKHAQEVRNSIAKLQTLGNATASARAAARLDDDMNLGVKLKLRVPKLEIESKDNSATEGQHGKNKAEEGGKQEQENESEDEHGIKINGQGSGSINVGL